MLGPLFSPLKEKWENAPVLHRMDAARYGQYLADVQGLMDTLSLPGAPPGPSAEILAEAEGFLALCLSLGDPLTVAVLAPVLRPAKSSAAAGGILAVQLEALLHLRRVEEGREWLDRYARLTPVPDPVFLHSCSARLAFLERRPDAMAAGFGKSLATAAGERRARLYDEWIWACLELSDEGGMDGKDAEAVIRAWSEEMGTSGGIPEHQLARAGLHALRQDTGTARRVLGDMGPAALPPVSGIKRLLLESRLALLEGRSEEAREAFRSAFQSGLDLGNAWAERGVEAAGLALVRASSGSEAMKQMLRELIEVKDWYLEPGHSSRVEALALRLAAALRDLRGDGGDLSADLLRRASAFHDIGKWHLPWCLLNRVLPLPAAELAQVRGHVSLGVSLLNAWGERDAAGVVREHHERMNGEGYPRAAAFSRSESALLALSEAFTGATSATRKAPIPRESHSLLPEFKALRGLWYEPAAVDALLLVAAGETEGAIRPGRRTP